MKGGEEEGRGKGKHEGKGESQGKREVGVNIQCDLETRHDSMRR